MNWREGARTRDPLDTCPRCGKNAPLFAADFRKFGRFSVRACESCRAVYVNGKRELDLTVHLIPAEVIQSQIE